MYMARHMLNAKFVHQTFLIDKLIQTSVSFIALLDLICQYVFFSEVFFLFATLFNYIKINVTKIYRRL